MNRHDMNGKSTTLSSLQWPFFVVLKNVNIQREVFSYDPISIVPSPLRIVDRGSNKVRDHQ